MEQIGCPPTMLGPMRLQPLRSCTYSARRRGQHGAEEARDQAAAETAEQAWQAFTADWTLHRAPHTFESARACRRPQVRGRLELVGDTGFESDSKESTDFGSNLGKWPLTCTYSA